MRHKLFLVAISLLLSITASAQFYNNSGDYEIYFETGGSNSRVSGLGTHAYLFHFSGNTLRVYSGFQDQMTRILRTNPEKLEKWANGENVFSVGTYTGTFIKDTGYSTTYQHSYPYSSGKCIYEFSNDKNKLTRTETSTGNEYYFIKIDKSEYMSKQRKKIKEDKIYE